MIGIRFSCPRHWKKFLNYLNSAWIDITKVVFYRQKLCAVGHSLWNNKIVMCICKTIRANKMQEKNLKFKNLENEEVYMANFWAVGSDVIKGFV